MSLQLQCLIEGENIVFPVTAVRDDKVSKLKESIRSERALDSLKDVGPHTLVLWKPKDSNHIATKPHNTLVERIKLLGDDLSKFADKLDSPKTVFSIFPTQPPGDYVHIIVKVPRTSFPAVAPSSSQDSPPNWLVELHKKLWGKRHLFGQIFRTANLTKADFIELQLRLESNDPSRNQSSYKAKNVSDIKAKFLREKSSAATAEFDNDPNRNLVPSVSLVVPPSTMSTSFAMDIDATAHRGDCNDGAEPSVIRDISVPLAGLANILSTSKTRPSAPPAVLDDSMNVDANAGADPAPQPVNCPSYITADAEELSTGSTAVLPCSIRYMDLTPLELEDTIMLLPVKRLTLIRDEWNMMIDLFNRRKRGVRGSAIFTGSPEIGKTCLLYYILILCLIKGQPVVFQDMFGDVYLITDKVRTRKKEVTVLGDDVLTLVDADDQICQPNKYIFRTPNLRILLMSSPMSRKDRKWLRLSAQDEGGVYAMKPWSQNEWLVASLFIVEKDITLNRFWKTFNICGSVPYQFLCAAQSCKARKYIQMEILHEIQMSCKDIIGAINGVVRDADVVPHRAFVVHPSDKRRLVDCVIKAISKGAMNTVIKTLDTRSADAAFDLYNSTRGSTRASAFRGNMFERKVHMYLPRGAHSFTVRSLDDGSDRRLDLLEGVKYFAFGPPQVLSDKIANCVAAREAAYFQPISDNFASLDSIIYQPNHPLIGIQITNASTHPIETKGLKALQSLLSPKNETLSPLQPKTGNPWVILFVVPTSMERSFTKQRIIGDASAAWRNKIVQYVLGLDVQEVFRAQFQDEQELENECEDEQESENE